MEPFADHTLRLHKAVVLENLQDKIVLLQNALSDKRGEIKLLEKMSDDQFNLGAQRLSRDEKRDYTKADMSTTKNLVETILLDDIVDYVPPRSIFRYLDWVFCGYIYWLINIGVYSFQRSYSKAVMKIDIEGFETYAFLRAAKLFEKLDFRQVYMEWIHASYKEVNLVTRMIDFFVMRNFTALSHDNNALDPKIWTEWPRDMRWVKDWKR